MAATALAFSLAAASLVAGLTVAPTDSASAASPTPVAAIALTRDDGKDTILAGENATYDVTITNDASGADWFNIGATLLVPNGIEFVAPSKLGSPVVFASGTQIPDADGGAGTQAVPAGFQLWVFEDVADLPQNAVYDATVTVRPRQKAPNTTVDPDATYFPVGADYDLQLNAYSSVTAATKPVFAGSTGVRTVAAKNDTRDSSPVTVNTEVVALHLYKDEPSPESELPRGVHNRDTVYTLTVKTTSEGVNEPATVVDYIPAGLEFLGCADADNSTATTKYAGGIEYTGATDLDTANTDLTTPTCDIPVSVETVEYTGSGSGWPAGITNGVYTKVTWQIATLPPSSEYKITYAAGIPLFKNTMTFENGTPTPASLEQGSNLDNNTGATTRHSDETPLYTDGEVYKNYAVASSTYKGIVRAAGDRVTGDHDEEIVYSMDLRILKGVDTVPTNGTPDLNGQAEGSFRTGYVAKYTLDLLASEYTDASDIEVWDEIPNGLCPILPPGIPVVNGTFSIPQLDGSSVDVTSTNALPTECALGATGLGGWASPSVSGATVVEVAYVAASGTFYLHFAAPDVDATTGHGQIVYPVLMRPNYEDAKGLTSSQDRLTNKVIVNATTTTIDDVFTSTDPAPRVQTIADDSAATISSDPATIDKSVLPHNVALNADPADPCPTSGYDTDTTPGGGGPSPDFKLGDTVCFKLEVNFDEFVDTRNPKVTDFLPPNVTYTDSKALLTSTGPLGVVTYNEDTTVPGRVVWQPSTVTEDGYRFVPAGSKLTMYVWGEVSTLSADPATLDKPQNLMKFQQENVEGDIFFLRDAVEISVLSGVTINKGVLDVNGVDACATLPCDHVNVVENDLVRYTVTVKAPSYPVSDATVWDVLPAGITSSNVVPSPGIFTVHDDPAATLTGYDGPPNRSVIEFVSVPIAANSTFALGYQVRMPLNLSSGVSYTNTASVVHYRVTNNDGSTSTYEPTDTPFDGADNVPGTFASDPSDVYSNPATLDKTLVTTELTETGNSATQVTHGESATYQIAVTVPANTSVHNGVIADDGVLSKHSNLSDPHAYTPVSAVVSYPAGLTVPSTDFTFDTTTGRLEFPAIYDNTTSSPQTFTITLTLYSTYGWAHGDTLYNHATFKEGATLKAQDTATVPFVQPLPDITKSVNDGGLPVTVGQELTYTLTAKNGSGRPPLYNVVVTDCVPSELNTPSDFTTAAGTASNEATSAPCAAGRHRITWNVGTIGGGESKTLTYKSVVGPTAGGGGTYTNTATIVGDAYPTHVPADPARQLELTDNTSESVTVQEATLAKTVNPTTAAIGDSVTYTVDVTLPKNVNFYTPVITDPAPADLGTVTDITVTNPTGANFTCNQVAGDITCTSPNITSTVADRHVIITYKAKLVTTDLTDNRGDTRTNTAKFAWKTASTGGDDVDTEGSATLTIVEPAVDIIKKVKTVDANTGATAATVQPGEVFGYAITVSNPGGTNVSTAYDVVVKDVLPVGLSAPSSISNAGTYDAGTRTITWTLASVANGTPVTLTYNVSLSASSTLASPFTYQNTATVTSFSSIADETDPDRRTYTGGSDPANVLALFPHVDVTKSGPTTGATVGSDFPWTVTFTNNGLGTAASTTATDTLPTNWSYVGNMDVTYDGVTMDPADWSFDTATLTWTFADIAPGKSVVVTYDAKPDAAAWVTPGVGTLATHPHTNTVEITEVTDNSGGTGNATDTDFHGDEAEASTFLVGTDIAITKTVVTPVTQINAGDTVDFALTVSNNGAQTAAGIEVSDVLPAGMTWDHFTLGTFTCDPVVAGAVDCTLPTLAAGASATLHVFATMDAVTGVVSIDLTNSATVTMTTPEDPSKLTDNTDDVTVTVFAPKIEVTKTGVLAAGATGVPGDTITYDFEIKNLDLGATLTGVFLTDAMFPGVGDITYTWPTVTPGELGPGASATATGTYVLTQADIDAANAAGGIITNLVTATGTPPVGPDVTDTDTVDVTIPSTPSISLVKTAVLTPGSKQSAGGTVSYSFLVTNTGTVTLTAVAITDPLLGAPSSVVYGAWPAAVGTLAPGETVTATAVYTLTQANIDAAQVVNVATVTGTTPGGPKVSDDDTATVPIAQVASVVLQKTSAFAPGGSLRAGDGIVYTFSASNTGTVTIDQLEIVDNMPGLTDPVFSAWPSTPGKLLPGETVTTTATYLMTQADVDAGSVTNSAIIIATPPIGPKISGGSTSTIKVAPQPLVDLVKTGEFEKGSTGVVGDTVLFTFVATNRGNVTLTNVTITDPKPGVSQLTYKKWPDTAGVLAPGESVTATATYTLTAADVALGDVKNSASVTADGLVNGVTTKVAATSQVRVSVPTGLAATGMEIAVPLGAMTLLLLLGAGLLVVGRRRRRVRNISA